MGLKKHNKKFIVGMVITIGLFSLILSGCRILMSRQNWNKKWGPVVPHQTFPGDCDLCHLPDRWDKVRDDFQFDHEKETGYRLEGSHAQAACLRCHNDRGPIDRYVSRGCAGCHVDPHSSSLGVDCNRCHTQFDWRPSGLIGEHALTRFPLFGAHALATCESCHSGATAGNFRGAPIQCDLCHQDDLIRAINPDHTANGWTINCQDCHTSVRWENAVVKHTFFPLVGGHDGPNCIDCHTSGDFDGLSSDCYSCHQGNYESAKDHVSLNFSQQCQDCHTINAWLPATLDHSFFALTGGHANRSCSDCHVGGTFKGLSQNCNSCHNKEYQTAPNHIAQSYPLECQDCHATTAWLPASYDHLSFPLTGGHSGRLCADCHSSGTYVGLSTACYDCHGGNYASAKDHVSLNFSTQCQNCHSIYAWLPATLDHSFFALTGGHANRSCSDCHVGGTFKGLSQNCNSCHNKEYQTAPNHIAQSYPLECQDCHATTAWLPASYDHSSFPLTGGHSGRLCADCHSSGIYAGLPSACYSCHDDDYAGAANHATLNFSTDCTACHSTSVWKPSSFTHPFPLRSEHNVSCVTCHDSATVTVFTCFNCHVHRKDKSDDIHKGRRGYVYDSSACYTCHPKGN